MATKSRSGVDRGREEHQGQERKITKKFCGLMDVHYFDFADGFRSYPHIKNYQIV